MKDPLTTLGVAATVGAVALLVLRWLAAARRRGYPLYGYVGIVALIAAEVLLFQRVEPVGTFFTPLAWTCFLLVVDAGVFALRGNSRLRTTPRAFFGMAALSVPLWLLFEAYNLHLENWRYEGLPESLWQQALGSLWAYATILPALLESADLLAALGLARGVTARGWRVWLGRHNLMVVIGVLCLGLPLLLPRESARYLFALVWLAFIFLLEPVNLARGHDSLLADVKQNRGERLYCLMAAGFVCGLLWEFWNYWAGGRWVYTLPFAPEWKVFEMPLVGYLGFPFFALEFFAMYSFTAGELLRFRREK